MMNCRVCARPTTQQADHAKLYDLNLPVVKVVEKESAHLRLSNETLLPVNADHRAMCRFSDAENQKFRPVKDAIVAMARNSGRSVESLAPPFCEFLRLTILTE